MSPKPHNIKPRSPSLRLSAIRTTFCPSGRLLPPGFPPALTLTFSSPNLSYLASLGREVWKERLAGSRANRREGDGRIAVRMIDATAAGRGTGAKRADIFVPPGDAYRSGMMHSRLPATPKEGSTHVYKSFTSNRSVRLSDDNTRHVGFHLRLPKLRHIPIVGIYTISNTFGSLTQRNSHTCNMTTCSQAKGPPAASTSAAK